MLGEADCLPWVSVSHLRNQRLRGDLYVELHWLGGGAMQSTSNCLTYYLMQSVWVSEIQPHLSHPTLSSCEGNQNQEPLILPSL